MQIALGNWMNNRYTMLSTDDFVAFDALLGENFDGENTRDVLFHEKSCEFEGSIT